MTTEQHQLTDECSEETAIHPVMLTVIGSGGPLIDAWGAEGMLAFLVQRADDSTVVLAYFVVHLKPE